MAGEVCNPAVTPKLPKPYMRNLVKNRLKKGLVISIFGGVLCALYWKVYHMDYRQRKTREYFATYDPVKHFERMRDMGLFQWAKPKPGSKPIYHYWENDSECNLKPPEPPGKGKCLKYEDGSSDDDDE